MAKSKFDQCMPHVFEFEGGFVDDKHDPGGATNYGISIRWLRRQKDWLEYDSDDDGDLDADDMRRLTKEQATELYRRIWDGMPWLRLLEDPLPCFDHGINAGPRAAAKVLQRALIREGASLMVDGAVGPKTRKALREYPVSGEALAAERVRWYEALIAERPRFGRYRRGWLRRAMAGTLPNMERAA